MTWAASKWRDSSSTCHLTAECPKPSIAFGPRLFGFCQGVGLMDQDAWQDVGAAVQRSSTTMQAQERLES